MESKFRRVGAPLEILVMSPMPRPESGYQATLIALRASRAVPDGTWEHMVAGNKTQLGYI